MGAQWLCRVRLFVTPMRYSLLGSSVHEISQARTLEWAAISCSVVSSRPRDQTRVSCPASPASQEDSLPLSHCRACDMAPLAIIILKNTWNYYYAPLPLGKPPSFPTTRVSLNHSKYQHCLHHSSLTWDCIVRKQFILFVKLETCRNFHNWFY